MELPKNLAKNTMLLVYGGDTRRRSAKFLGFKGKYIVVSKYNGNDKWTNPMLITPAEVACIKEK